MYVSYASRSLNFFKTKRAIPAAAVSTHTAEAKNRSRIWHFFILTLEAALVSFKQDKYFWGITETARNYGNKHSKVFRVRQHPY